MSVTCTFAPCGKPVKARGLCAGHYDQRRRGAPLAVLASPTPRGLSAEERISRGSAVTPDGCMIWASYINVETGYGQVRFRGKMMTAHVLAYVAAYGPVPEGKVVDHTCRNRACVNARHLHAVTQKQNSENLGMRRNNTSGARGVYLHRASGLWHAQVTHDGRKYSGGYHHAVEDAGRAARDLRLALFTNNLADRRAA